MIIKIIQKCPVMGGKITYITIVQNQVCKQVPMYAQEKIGGTLSIYVMYLRCGWVVTDLVGEVISRQIMSKQTYEVK